MKQLFFWGVGLAGVGAILGYLGWRVALAFYDVYDDYRAGRETDQLRAEKAAMDEKKRQQNEARLDNGCEHQFDDVYGAFPPNVCCKCGMDWRQVG